MNNFYDDDKEVISYIKLSKKSSNLIIFCYVTVAPRNCIGNAFYIFI